MPPRIWLVHATAFFTLSTEALIGLLLPLLAVERGLPPAMLGSMVAVGSVGSLLLAVPAGALCDYFGDRRMLIAMALVMAITSALYPAAVWLPALALVQIVGGVSRSNTWVASQSYGVRAIDDVQRHRFTGHFSFAASIGMLVAPLGAGYCMELWGIAAGFYFMGIWAGVVVLIGLVLPEHGRAERTGPRQSVWSVSQGSYAAAWPLLLRPMLLLLLILTLLRLSGAAMSATFFPVHLKQVGLSPFDIGMLVAVINAGNSLGSLLAAPLVKRSGSGAVIFLSMAISVIAMALIPAFSDRASITALTLVHGTALGISLPILLAGLARYSKPHERGLVLALRSVFNRIGYLVAPLALGWLVAGFNILTAFLILAAVVLALLAIAYLLWRRGQRLNAAP